MIEQNYESRNHAPSYTKAETSSTKFIYTNKKKPPPSKPKKTVDFLMKSLKTIKRLVIWQ